MGVLEDIIAPMMIMWDRRECAWRFVGGFEGLGGWSAGTGGEQGGEAK